MGHDNRNAMPAGPASKPIKPLVGWRRIADYLNVAERTAKGYETRANDPLPVCNNDDATGQCVAAWPHQLDAWVARNAGSRRRRQRPAASTQRAA